MKAARALPRPSTIRDVAAHAGVSIATVSRVINDSGPVGVETRQRVQAALAETDFRANRMGRALKSSRSQSVGVLVPSLRNPIFAEAAEGIQLAAEREGYGVLLMSAGYSPERELRAVETLLENRVDGILLTVADDAKSPALALLRSMRYGFVTMFNPVAAGESGVTIDNATAAEELVGELVALGHRRIDMVAGSFRQSDRSRLRRGGFRRALKRHGACAGNVVEVDLEGSRVDVQVRGLMACDDPPTALFCSTDMLALSTIRTLRGLGYRVPEDVSVAGFDGIAVGEWFEPDIATVVQPAEEIGRIAFEHLLRRIAGADPPRRIDLPYHVRIGHSVAPR